MAEARELPWYRCHKQVRALKIKEVETRLDSNLRPVTTITPADEGYEPFQVDFAYVDKHKPQAGGYFVVYDDGYQSFSPAKAFEDGYTRIAP